MAAEVRAKLIEQGLATDGAVFENVLPASPDTCVALDEGSGTGGATFFSEPLGVEQPALRVRTRGAPDDAAAPRLAIERIYQFLRASGAFVQSGVRYLAFEPLQSPYPLGRDDNARMVWAVNFLVTKEHSPTT